MSTTDATVPAPAPAPAAPGAKKKKPRTVEDELILVAVAKTPDGKSEQFVPLPMPEGYDLKNKASRTQKAVRAAVKAAMEKGGPAVALYGGKKLRVVFAGETFMFNAKVEEKKIVNTVVTEVPVT